MTDIEYPIDLVGFGRRQRDALVRDGITTLAALLDMTDEDLRRVPGIGASGIAEFGVGIGGYVSRRPVTDSATSDIDFLLGCARDLAVADLRTKAELSALTERVKALEVLYVRGRP